MISRLSDSLLYVGIPVDEKMIESEFTVKRYHSHYHCILLLSSLPCLFVIVAANVDALTNYHHRMKKLKDGRQC